MTSYYETRLFHQPIVSHIAHQNQVNIFIRERNKTLFFLAGGGLDEEGRGMGHDCESNLLGKVHGRGK